MKFLFAAGLVLSVAAPAAFCVSMNPLNVRPGVTVNTPAGEASLQDILNSAYGCTGCVDAADQQSAGMWGVPGLPPQVTTPLLRFTSSGNADLFGIWSGEDTSSIVTLAVFEPGAPAGVDATIKWLTPTSGIIGTTNPYDCVAFGGTVNCGTFTGISMSAFGFYINRAATLTDPGTAGYLGNYWSVDQLNSPSGTGAGAAQELSYYQPGLNRWTIAFEDTSVASGGSDQDYNDMVVTIESLVPIPEPGSIVLFGTTLLFCGGLLRRYIVGRA